MGNYILSKQADADLFSIYEYTLERWGLEQFHLYRAQIEQALDAVAAKPNLIGSKAREDLASGCRLFHVGHHYIAYRIGANGVEVGRILHERMHFEKQVSDSVF